LCFFSSLLPGNSAADRVNHRRQDLNNACKSGATAKVQKMLDNGIYPNADSEIDSHWVRAAGRTCAAHLIAQPQLCMCVRVLSCVRRRGR